MSNSQDSSLFREVYTYHSEEQVDERYERELRTKSGSDIWSSPCEYLGYACTKSTSKDEEHGMTRPLGVCSASSPDGKAVITCPDRFKSRTVYQNLKDHLFFDTEYSFHVLEERSLGNTGRVDLIPVIHDDGDIKDFAAIEIQSSYFSGSSIRPEFNEYMDEINERNAPDPPKGSRGMDYRSCIDKRLLPQIEEKIEVTEAWEKPLGAIVQTIAFENSQFVQRIERVPEDEATFFWFVYDYVEDTPQYRLELNQIYPTTYEAIQDAIGASKAPEIEEFTNSLENRLQRERRQGITFDDFA
jgi:hypothetical protein